MKKIQLMVMAALASMRITHERKLAQREGSILLANIAKGTHKGSITKTADGAVTERYLLAKFGASATSFDICDTADVPFGVCTDEAVDTGDLCNIELLTGRSSTVLMRASAAIVQGAYVEPGGSGRVQTLGTSSGTHYIVGKALDAAAAAGDLIEVMPLLQQKIIA